MLSNISHGRILADVVADFLQPPRPICEGWRRHMAFYGGLK